MFYREFVGQKSVRLICSWEYYRQLYRSSHRRYSVKKSVLKIFANFTKEHLCWSLFLIMLQAFRPAILLKRDYSAIVLVKLAKILRTSNLKNICERLLLTLPSQAPKSNKQKCIQNPVKDIRWSVLRKQIAAKGP